MDPSANISSLRTDRRGKLGEAFLARRLTGAQLKEMMQSVEASEQVFNDRFERLTKRGNDSASPVHNTFAGDPLEILGFTEQFEQLSDDKVWSAQERALYRRLAHPDISEPAKVESRGDLQGAQVALHLRTNLPVWDKNGNLRLENQELDLLCTGGHYGQDLEIANDPTKAPILAAVRAESDFLESVDPYDGEGVSEHDVLALFGSNEKRVTSIKEQFLERLGRYQKRAEQLGEVKPIGMETIEPDTIHQGAPGSCVLLATAAGLDSEKLESLFNQMEGGMIEVNFPDGEKEIVSDLTLCQRLLQARGKDSERWPGVLETAMAQRLYREKDTDDNAILSAIDGIEPEYALEALTGGEAEKRSLDEMTVNETHAMLAEMTSGTGPVICGSRPTAASDFISIESLHNGINNGHAYTVRSYCRETKTVTLRNPWGHGEWEYQDSEDDGIFAMPLRDFYTSFRWVAHATASGDAADLSP